MVNGKGLLKFNNLVGSQREKVKLDEVAWCHGELLALRLRTGSLDYCEVSSFPGL